MALGRRLAQLYLNWIYTPVYDATVAQIAPYRRFQQRCVEKIPLQQGASVLSIGVGTGNELVRLLEHNDDKDFSLVGVDISRPALVRAYRKSRRRGKDIGILQMDAQRLGFRDGCFDVILCLHTMFLLPDDQQATRELVRVLKQGGEFIATYPSGKGSYRLGWEVGKSVLQNMRRGRVLAAGKEALAGIAAVLAYIPITFSFQAQARSRARADLERMLASIALTEYTIEEDRAYQELVVWGRR